MPKRRAIFAETLVSALTLAMGAGAQTSSCDRPAATFARHRPDLLIGTCAMATPQ